MNIEHTPAPWEARIDVVGIDVIQSKSGFGVTQIGNYNELIRADYPIETAKANAKLIAAAPELLEALKYLLLWRKHLPKLAIKDLLNAESAIKKATE